MKKYFLFFLFLLLSFSIFLLAPKKSFAYLWCDGQTCGGYTKVSNTCQAGVPADAQHCSTSGTQYCGEGASRAQCPYSYCGWGSNFCCSGASPWTKWQGTCGTLMEPSCGTFETWPNCTGPLVPSCDNIITSNGYTCSMGDKCAVHPTTILQPGQCDCSVGPFNYKTCCDSSTGQQVYATCYPANDGTGHWDGDCPTGGSNVTVFCGGNGQPACGQASCDQFAPWQTVSGYIKDTGDKALSGVVVTIHNSSRNITHTFTTDASGHYQDNATTVRKGDNFTVTPNNSAGSTPCNNGYICGNSWSPNSPNPYSESNSSGCAITGTNFWTCNIMYYTPGQIGGTVYIDYNHNQTVDGQDGPSNVAIVLTDSATGQQATSDTANGTWFISGLSQGSHTITATTNAAGWSIENPTQTISIGPNVTTMNFYITPTFTISGVIYNDIDKNSYYNPQGSPPNGNNSGLDTAYSGSATVKLTGPTNTTLTFSGGTFTTGQTLYAGTYTISYTNLPSGYQTTYPLNGPPPSLQVTVGPGGLYGNNCNANNNHDTYCDVTGNIHNADFGITNEFAWIQGICSDMRVDAGFTDPVPPTANCGGTSAPYANICTSGTVGVIYTGATDANFLIGSASTTNWVVGGNATSNYPESFSPVNQTIIRTSYSYVTTTLKQAGITSTDLSTVCTLNSCSLPTAFPNTISSGVYLANGDLNLNSFTEPAGKNITILVNGTTTINGKINIPLNSGSAFTIISKGNIIIPPTVGESVITSLNSDLDGFYSTDNSFIVQSANNGKCNTDGSSNDLKLNIGGAVLVNAGETGGSFQNARDLCVNDTSCPVTTISQRIDLMLNAPAILKHKNNFFQEVAP